MHGTGRSGDRGITPAQLRAELRRFNVHGLRHFFASEPIRQSYPPTEVAARSGSPPMVTIDARWYGTAQSDA